MMTFEERVELAKKVDACMSNSDHLSQDLIDQVIEFQAEMIDSYAAIAGVMVKAVNGVLETNQGTTAFSNNVKIPIEIFDGLRKLTGNIDKELIGLLRLRYPAQAID